MNRLSFILRILISAYALVSCLSSAAYASTYRWVDENGHVHYGDHMPPSEVHRAYSVINKEGVTVNSVEKAKTKEQLAKENRLKAQQAKEKDHDQILLSTYSKVSDLEETRDRYIASLEGLIKVSQHKLTHLNIELEKLNKSAANLERNGKPVPPEIRNDIKNIQSQIDQENNFILAQRTQQKQTKKKFAGDIARFKQLKAQQQTQD
ncbi:MAG: DUF4124 domain-containing protein [Gammaproteobacteria bacterium]